MTGIFENYRDRQFLFLLGAVLLIALLFIHETRRHLRLQREIAAAIIGINQARAKEAAVMKMQEATTEKAALLAQYEQRIPIADSGFVWINRVVRGAAPKLALRISPPEFETLQLPLSSNYCCGSFDVRGSARLDELLQILQKIESDLPFARIQDLQFSFEQDRVNFSFSLLAILKLNADLES